MTADRAEPPQTYHAAVKFSSDSIVQRPFDQSGNLLVGNSCCTDLSLNNGHILCLACQTSIETANRIVGRGGDGTKLSCQVDLLYTFAGLQHSARLGCHMCAILEASSLDYLHAGKPSAFEYEPTQASEAWLGFKARSDSDSSDRFVMHLMLYTSYAEYSCALIELVYTGDDNADARPMSTLIESTRDESALQLAAGWLRDCHESHPDCIQQSGPDPHVPKRLLEINELRVRVVLNQGYRYACLSHRWGDQVHVPKQLSEDISSAVFEISNLPKTFQDAIEITKRLGLRYLWIDCFCIIQGSVQDWIEQSAVMADIYSHSEFTVAALASTDVTQGCFRTLQPLMLTPLYVDGFTIRAVRDNDFYRLEVEGFKHGISPLHERGWVVQERLTAPRTIFFGALGIYWECKTSQASQSHHYSFRDGNPGNRSPKLELKELYDAVEAASVASNFSKFQESWYRLLKTYSRCNLTYHSDRLIALSGITNAVSRRTGKKLIQGLWEDHITDDMLWRLTSGPLHSTIKVGGRPKQKNPFPSWTWASLEGEISHYTAAGSISWDIVVSHAPDSPAIQFDTWLREAYINQYNTLVFKQETSSTTEPEESGSSWFLDEVGLDWSPEEEEINWFPDDIDDIPRDLWIGLIQHRVNKSPHFESFNCLVLAIVKPSVYRRIGVCQINFQSVAENPFTGPQIRLSLI